MNHRSGYVNDKIPALLAEVLLYLPSSYRYFLQLTVENNYLSDKDITTFTEKYANAKCKAVNRLL